MKKRGLELAANLLVVLIISVVVLGLAGGITWKIFCASGDKIEQLDAQAEKYIEQRLTSGAAVQAPDASKDARPPAGFCGAKAPAYAEFGVGVRNDFNDAVLFTIECAYDGYEVGSAFTAVGEPCSGGTWKAQYTSQLSLEARAKDTAVFLFNVPPAAKMGRHVFTIRVKDDAGEAYGATKLYLTVK